jgi:hypothetical protein
MPAKAARIHNPQVNPGRRHHFNLDILVKVAVPLLLVCFLFIAWQMESFGWYSRLFQRNTYTTFLGSVGALYTLAFLAMQLVRTVLWWRYRPYPLPSGPLPKVTVLIPAYNEGAMVEKSLYSVAAADYPKDLLEIICIDRAGELPGPVPDVPQVGPQQLPGIPGAAFLYVQPLRARASFPAHPGLCCERAGISYNLYLSTISPLVVSLLPHPNHKIRKRHGPGLFLSLPLQPAAREGCRLRLRSGLFLLRFFLSQVG